MQDLSPIFPCDLAQAVGQPVREIGMGEAVGFVHGLVAGLIESDPIIYVLMQDLTPMSDSSSRSCSRCGSLCVPFNTGAFLSYINTEASLYGDGV